MVKVIGSASLGIGQLKHLRPEDQPMLSLDHDEQQHDYGQRDSFSIGGTRGNDNLDGKSDSLSGDLPSLYRLN